MKLSIKVQPRSSKEVVEKLADGSYKVFVHAPPADGEANKAVIEVLAKHFKIAKSSVKIITGDTNKNKIIEIVNRGSDNCVRHAKGGGVAAGA